MNYKQRILKIHHLSDLHLGSLQYKPDIKPSFVSLPKTQSNRNKYISHLKQCKKSNLPDLIVISGDLTSYASEEDFNEAQDFIMDILKILKEKPETWRKDQKGPYILIVPGNHDLDWSGNSFSEKVTRYSRMSDNLYQDGSVISALYHKIEQGPYWDFGEECNLFVYLFNTVPLGGVIDQTYKDMYDSLCRINKSTSDNEFTALLSRFEKEMRKDPGQIANEDLTHMESILKRVPKERIKIAIMHHNLSGVPTEDIENFDTIINAGLVKRYLMDAGFNIVLHGHRHFVHFSQEKYLGKSLSWDSGLLIAGADTFGCDKSAPFLELTIYSQDKPQSNDFPAPLCEIRKGKFVESKYEIDSAPVILEIFNPQACAEFRELLMNLGRGEVISNKQSLSVTINKLQPYLKDLKNSIGGWGEASNVWIENFHFQLERYYQIFATDIDERLSVSTPQYEQYLIQQYSARLKRFRTGIQSKKLTYSPEIYTAIVRTGWEPDVSLWDDYELDKSDPISNSSNNLEIVRILVRGEPKSEDRQALENLNYYHKLFAIPLFVIDRAYLETSQLIDFVLGMDNNGAIIKCYEFIDANRTVQEVKESQGYHLKDTFFDILSNPALKTIDQYLGFRVMIRNPEKLKDFADKYDVTRKASKMILNVLEENLKPSLEKTGMDIGCGTGNYTIPFVGRFCDLIGLDILDEMLAKARKKTDKIKWISADALNTTLENDSCDCVWGISTLHYFVGLRQKALFQEVFRILRPGGVMLFDTEFAEQQPSLWLTHFFPSLKERYKNSCLNSTTYHEWLAEIGFSSIKTEHIVYDSNEDDAFLRIGQHRPEKYINQKIRDGIPAFKEMSPGELDKGLRKLRASIENKQINKIISEYEAKATIPGDIGIIVATKPDKLHY